MDVFHLLGIVLAASLLESLLSVVFAPRRGAGDDVGFDVETEARYSRLADEYEDVGA